jgi:hypothetical protein
VSAHRQTAKVQERLLAQLIDAHRETAFGRDHGFASIRTYEDFAAAVPVAPYERMMPYVNRVLEGETTALLPPGEEPLMFSMTSGTTGTPKYIPVTRRFADIMRGGWNIFGFKVLYDHPAGWLRPIVQISSAAVERTSPKGLPCGAISGLLAAEQQWIVKRMYVVPPAVSAIKDPVAKYYTILRCGISRPVGIITTANPSSTIKLAETGIAHSEQLVRDIADGTCNPPGEAGAGCQFGSPRNKALANRLEQAISRDGKLLPRHYWHPAFLTNWTGGTLRLYLPRLRDLFGDVPIRDIGLLASEGRFSIPIRDGTAAGLAEICNNVLEFMPKEEEGKPAPRTLRAHQTEIGQDYFLVISNWAGLWRYNIDDLVRVVDHVGQSPVFEFLSRGRHTASITGEKITEYQVVEAMRLACQQIGQRLERFEMQGVFAATPYYELRMEGLDEAAAGRLAQLMDQALAGLNLEYYSKRSGGRLAMLRPRLLQPGSLQRAEDANIRQRNGRSEQYKHKYLMTEVLEDGKVT